MEELGQRFAAEREVAVMKAFLGPAQNAPVASARPKKRD